MLVRLIFTTEPFYCGALSSNEQIIRAGTCDETYLSSLVFPKPSISSITWAASSAFGFLQAKSLWILSASESLSP